jgi:hypothetical protein
MTLTSRANGARLRRDERQGAAVVLEYNVERFVGDGQVGPHAQWAVEPEDVDQLRHLGVDVTFILTTPSVYSA